MRPTAGKLALPSILLLTVACSDNTGPNESFIAQGQMVVGRNHSCYLGLAGRAQCWGWGSLGQLGAGDTTSSGVPVDVVGGVRFVHLAAGAFGTCGLTADGDAWCWGNRITGQLGDGSSSGVADRPVAIGAGLKFTELSIGDGHSCGLERSGDIYCWGVNVAGQLGDGSTVDRLSPTHAAPGLRFVSVGAGLHATCGVATDGAAYCWGDNTWGQLGTGVIGGHSAEPVPVAGGLNFKSIEMGTFVACAVTRSLEAYCWGTATFGRLGAGIDFEAPQSAPVKVAGGLRFESVMLGADHACGVTTEGSAWCWGLNTYGKMGSPSGPSSLEPVEVVGAHQFTMIAPGANHSCGVTRSSEVFCWGQNALGQLGVPSVQRPTFVPNQVNVHRF